MRCWAKHSVVGVPVERPSAPWSVEHHWWNQRVTSTVRLDVFKMTQLRSPQLRAWKPVPISMMWPSTLTKIPGTACSVCLG